MQAISRPLRTTPAGVNQTLVAGDLWTTNGDLDLATYLLVAMMDDGKCFCDKWGFSITQFLSYVARGNI